MNIFDRMGTREREKGRERKMEQIQFNLNAWKGKIHYIHGVYTLPVT